MRFWKSRHFEKRPLVTMQVATFLNDEPRRMAALRVLVSCFQAQTYPHWEVLLTHDGPVADTARAEWTALGQDKRIRLIETPERKLAFGHPWRLWSLVNHANGAVFGFTNDDNYYAPVYLEWMMHELISRKADMVYCDMVHSHKQWKALNTRPTYRHLDLGGFLVRAELARSTPWVDFSFKGDGTYINALAAKAKRAVKVPALLFVHN